MEEDQAECSRLCLAHQGRYVIKQNGLYGWYRLARPASLSRNRGRENDRLIQWREKGDGNRGLWLDPSQYDLLSLESILRGRYTQLQFLGYVESVRSF